MDTADTALRPPETPVVVMSRATTLMAQERPDELLDLANSLVEHNPQLAERILAKSTQVLPQHYGLAEAFCLIAERRGDAMAANTRWQRVRRKFSSHQPAHEAYIEAMLRQNRGGEAALAAQHALLFFGQKLPLRDAQARAAEAQEQWAEAARLWAGIAQYHPDHPTAADRAGRAQHNHDTAPRARSQLGRRDRRHADRTDRRTEATRHHLRKPWP